MRVAIAGGGAAGLVTAYLLGGRHSITVFEAGRILGGHVRTLHGNVHCRDIPPQLVLDAGVVEFDEHHFPTFGRLLDRIGIRRRPVPGTTALFLADGRRFRSQENIARGSAGPGARLAAVARLLSVAPAQRRFERRTGKVSVSGLYGHSIGDFLQTGTHQTWMRMLLMYAYSIPYPQTLDIPAVLAVPVLRAFTDKVAWTAIEGGSYAYLQRLTATTRARFVLEARVKTVTRSGDGVTIALAGGQTLGFDAVVFATPPDQVLKLLGDATDAETRYFSAWQANRIHTTVHTDTGLYERRGAHYYSEFDLFECADGSAGYYAYLNRLAGLPADHPDHYFLAYGLDDHIDPGCVVHEQYHHTPLYTVAALRHREEVLAAQGEQRTYYAGAWLGNGLHEGAVTSAVEVSRRLGGAVL